MSIDTGITIKLCYLESGGMRKNNFWNICGFEMTKGKKDGVKGWLGIANYFYKSMLLEKSMLDLPIESNVSVWESISD